MGVGTYNYIFKSVVFQSVKIKNFKRIWTKTGLIWAKDSIQNSSGKSSLSAIGKPNGHSKAELCWATLSQAEPSWAKLTQAGTSRDKPGQAGTSRDKPGQAYGHILDYRPLSTKRENVITKTQKVGLRTGRKAFGQLKTNFNVSIFFLQPLKTLHEFLK